MNFRHIFTCISLFFLLFANCTPEYAKYDGIIGNTWIARSQLLVTSAPPPSLPSQSYSYSGLNDIQLLLTENGELNFQYVPRPLIGGPVISPQPLPPGPVDYKNVKSTYRFAGDSVYIVTASDTALLSLLYAGERFAGNRWPHGDSIFLRQLSKDSMVNRFQWTKRRFDQQVNDTVTFTYEATTGFRNGSR